MTYLACVCAAGVIHLLHNWRLPGDDSKVLGPQLPYILVTFALMDVIYDNCLVPRRFKVMPVGVRRIYEFVVAFLLLELGMRVFWEPVARLIKIITKIILLGTGLLSEAAYGQHENFWVGCVTLPLSLVILAFVGQATDHFPMLRGRRYWVRTKVELNVNQALRYLKQCQRATGRPLPHYAAVLQSHKEAETLRRRGRIFLRHFNSDDEHYSSD